MRIAYCLANDAVNTTTPDSSASAHSVEGQIGHQLLELPVLFLQLSQPPDLCDLHLAILPASHIVRRYADP